MKEAYVSAMLQPGFIFEHKICCSVYDHSSLAFTPGVVVDYIAL